MIAAWHRAWLVSESGVKRRFAIFTHFHCVMLHLTMHLRTHLCVAQGLHKGIKIGRLWCPRSAQGDCTMGVEKNETVSASRLPIRLKKECQFQQILRSIPPWQSIKDSPAWPSSRQEANFCLGIRGPTAQH